MHSLQPAYVGTVLPVTDDIEFWSRQLAEHALFMQLGLDDPKLKQRCAQLHQAWEHFRHGPRQIPTAITLVHHLRDLQLEVHARLGRGEWLGWIWPLFVDHIRREGDYFLGALQGAKLDPVAEAQMWLTFMADHAAFAAHLLDPTETARIREALTLLDKFGELWHGCGTAVNDQLLSLTLRSGTDLDSYLKGLGIGTPNGARSIIHPVLAEHVVREGQRFLKAMSALQQQASALSPQ
jgi:hypothetical protein